MGKTRPVMDEWERGRKVDARVAPHYRWTAHQWTDHEYIEAPPGHTFIEMSVDNGTLHILWRIE